MENNDLSTSNEIEENQLNYTSSKYKTPDGVPADTIIFTIVPKNEVDSLEKQLQVMLIKRKKWPYKGCWALPGGFSNENEDIKDSAKRELKEETNIEGIYVKHTDVYSTPGRDPRGWIITSAYYALVNEKHLEHRIASDDASDVRLFNIEEVLDMLKGDENGTEDANKNKLAFDHKVIIYDALKRIKVDMHQTDIAKQFLPEEFTLSELYEVIKAVTPEFDLGEKPNFIRKMTKSQNRSGTIQPVLDGNGKQKTTKKYQGRPAGLFTFTGYVPQFSIYS